MIARWYEKSYITQNKTMNTYALCVHILLLFFVHICQAPERNTSEEHEVKRLRYRSNFRKIFQKVDLLRYRTRY